MYRVPLIFKANGKNLFPKLILRAPFGNLYCCHSICHPSLGEDNFSVVNKLNVAHIIISRLTLSKHVF